MSDTSCVECIIGFRRVQQFEMRHDTVCKLLEAIPLLFPHAVGCQTKLPGLCPVNPQDIFRAIIGRACHEAASKIA
jgi:hypothetical protein